MIRETSMRFGINFRGDLEKLDDAEIASRFEALIVDRAAMYQSMPAHSGNTWLYQQGLGLLFGRGFLHARIFYKLSGFLSYANSSLYELYLVDCELKDVRDEMQNRVKRRKAISVTS